MVELSSLDVLFLARELAVLEDAIIDRVYETAPNEFLFRTRHPQRGRQAFLVRPGSFGCLVEEPPETPESPTSFALLLRKQMAGARIRRVDQHEFDRLVVFNLDQRGTPSRLLIELFGKGNLVFVGEDEKIRLVQRTETYRDRTLRRGEAFKFPPRRVNPATLSRSEFDALCEKSERDAVRFLALDLGLGGDLSEELLHRSSVPKDRKMAKLSEDERDQIWKTWQAIVHSAPQPGTREGPDGVRVESIPFDAPKFAGSPRTSLPTVCAAIDAARRRDQATAPPPVDEQRERLVRQIEHQEKALDTFRAEASAWEARGRLVYEHYGDVNPVLRALTEAVNRGGWSLLPELHQQARLPPAVRRIDPVARRVTVEIGGQTIDLDPQASLDRNASNYYEEAKRLRAKLQGAEASVAEARKRLEKEKHAPPPAKARPRATGRRFWFESFRWFYTSEGFLVVGGRDAAANEKLVKKHLSASDLYFHADFHGAPSCVLKGHGPSPGEASLREAAQFAVSYSKAFAQVASADAFWVKPEQVSKTAPTGEYVSRGSFVIRGQRNYIHTLSLEVAIGRVGLGKDGRPATPAVIEKLMGGPPAAVAHWAPRFALVERGTEKPATAARTLAPAFAATLDEVQAALPAGTVRIVKAPEGNP